MFENLRKATDPVESWTEEGRRFLLDLQEACRQEGFVQRAEPTFAVGEMWDATLTLDGPLGRYTLRLWTTWTKIHNENEQVMLTLTLRHAAGLQEFRPDCACHSLDGFRSELEFLRTIIQHTVKLSGLQTALVCNASAKWRREQRSGFLAIIRSREAGTPTKAGSA